MALKRYFVTNRLADVLALIQVLALDVFAHRSESGLQKELQGTPKSADKWITVAIEHPEFFRVDKTHELPISLVARHATPQEDTKLDPDFISKLLDAAIHLHDREISRRAIWRSAGPTLLGVLLGGLLTFGTSYLSGQFQTENQIALQRNQDKKTVYSRLMGRKFVTKQLLVSRSEAMIFSDYYEARWILTGSQKDSQDLQEAQRWMHRSEDLVFEIQKSHQALFEDIGIVRASFADTAKLNQLTDQLLKFKAIKSAMPPTGTDTTALKHWKEESIRQVQAFVESEYGKPLDELLNYLLEQVTTRE